MNEGEFKKQINQLIAYETEYISNVIEKEDVLKIINKAKKEYEKLIAGTWCLKEEGFHSNTYAKDSWLISSKVIKWFRKWFGETEEERG